MIVNPKVKKYIPLSDYDDVFVVADFDRTITTGSSKTSWSILAGSSLVPDSYISERQALFDHYRPIEISDSVDYDFKMNAMKEWFQKHIELFVKYKISEDIFRKAASDLRVMGFRPHALEFINFLHDNNIPLIIISAGIGNFIETFLEHNDCYYDNICVSSNKIIFKNGVASGVGANIIHSFNKNEVSLPSEIDKKIQTRNNVILLGDQIRDLKMVDKTKHELVISVGFSGNEISIEEMTKYFDVVCSSDEGYASIITLLFK